MKRLVLLSVVAFLGLTLFGCGNSSPQPQLFSTQVLSNAAFDGDIERDPLTSTLTITQGNPGSVFVGFDPRTGTETRAFLDFSLSTVPVNAIINSATVHIFVNSIRFSGLPAVVPVSIDLVSFDPPTLIGADFSRPLILTVPITPPLATSDIGMDVAVDITSLMVEAQRQRLPALQLRLVAETAGGLVEINDTTVAPQLTVTYF